MSVWRYRCLECKNEIEEWRPEPNHGSAKFLICPGCTRIALNRLWLLGDPEMPTYCEPCEKRGKPKIMAVRFVSGTPMCEPCFGGGIGPGVTKAAEPQRVTKSGPATPTVPPPGLCGCGRSSSHAGRCHYRALHGWKKEKAAPHGIPPAIPATRMKTSPAIAGAPIGERSVPVNGSTLELLRKVIVDLKARRDRIEVLIAQMEESERMLQDREL
jgi:hypothetical protein